jgi:hypothetical protein
LEALLTVKPIVLYADQRYVALRPEARDLLRRRVLLAETPGEFLASLDGFLRQGQFDAVEPADRAFLRAYGTYVDDGGSAERAVDALKAITQNARPEDARTRRRVGLEASK